MITPPSSAGDHGAPEASPRGRRAWPPLREKGPPPGDVLSAPAEGQHIAQLYGEPEILARTVGQFAVTGLRTGEAVLLVATAAHRPAIVRQIEAAGYATEALVGSRQLVFLDAVVTLARILMDGEPDRARFQAVIGGAIDLAEAAGYRRLRAFGEMVNVIRQVSFATAIRLEELWNELIAARRIALLCGYSIDVFDPQAYQGLVQQVSAVHSHLVPVEDSARFDRAVERAYREVFGVGQDAGLLRRMFLAHYPRPAAMPDAQAAILAAQEFVPEATAALLDRIRHHYQSVAAPA